ncbi:hypothetical protein P152DRAFT_455479 [Eremomyces bilateralis CBS 781.70]|uniref:Uncharacterized protein n=1 Tax=Eremomyces bilateralis CBS 781.70 TaxID=1392243 RepID=A0A6G1GCK3_9PEZI|nr:uncharacterized protein P152DRAFT_455479 [Eremomyces bilateralis CBS 781.70]KAF1815763.1 hypothetical protein P152DRAFT_455479 [Eremomyces bilateralis CBS 781.70]
MNDHSLRLLTALTFIPAFPLCLAHGINSGRAVPAVGLVPLAGSAVFAIFLIQWKKQREDATPVHPAILYVVDSVLATGLMIVLVYTWVDLTWVTRSQTMLAAYATFPLLVNL